MKKLLLILIVIACSCKTTKIDHKTGDRNPTGVKKHFQKVHPIGFWTGKKYIVTDAGLRLTPIKK